MPSTQSLISTDIDYERPGLQNGTLRVPYSHDRSAYGHIPIPITVLKGGDGPTVLLTGGNHGDEYEGPVALMKLIRRLPSMSIKGRLIVVPALNFPAFINGSRTSPIDRGNLNRVFPGARNGHITEMIAHYADTELFPRADVVIDLHAGGASFNHLPTVLAAPPADISRSAETVNADALRVARHAQRAIADQAGAQQRRRLDVAVLLRQVKAVAAVGNGALRETAVYRVAGKTGIVAKIFPRRQAVAAMPARVANPGHAHPVSEDEPRHAHAEPGDRADDFVTWNDRLFGMLELMVNQMKIGAAHAARVNIDQNLAGAGHGIRQLLLAQKRRAAVE